MLKKTIKYTDFNDNEITYTEDFYFNLTEAELIEMESNTEGGLKAKLERIVNTRDISAIMEIFKDIIVRSYGVKSDDGKRFMKSKEITEAFTQTNAYSELYMEMLSNVDTAIAFVTGIIPKKISSKIDQAQIDSIKANPSEALKQ